MTTYCSECTVKHDRVPYTRMNTEQWCIQTRNTFCNNLALEQGPVPNNSDLSSSNKIFFFFSSNFFPIIQCQFYAPVEIISIIESNKII